LYVGEAALAFITSVSKDLTGANVFNLNGSCETIENGIKIIKELDKNSDISCVNQPFPFPPDLDDDPLRKHIGSYPSISVKKGIRDTFNAFKELKLEGRCPSLSE